MRNGIQPNPSSFLPGVLQHAPLWLEKMLGRRLALGLLFLCAALLAQPCTATSGQWEYTGSLNTARFHHTSTLLPDGKVLVVGGEHGHFPLASAELYDPASGTFSDTGSLSTPRDSHTATLLPNGKVLVAGGRATDPGMSLASAELYDPATGTWSLTGSLNTGRISIPQLSCPTARYSSQADSKPASI